MDPFERLDAALDAYDQRQTAAQSAAEKKRAEEDAFIAEFSNFRTITAHPVLEEIGNRLKQRGHEFRVEMSEVPTKATSKNIGITLHVYPAGTGGQYGSQSDHPQFTVNGDPYSRKVRFHSVITFPGGGMQSGPDGPECWLAELTADALRTKAVECIAKSFATKR